MNKKKGAHAGKTSKESAIAAAIAGTGLIYLPLKTGAVIVSSNVEKKETETAKNTIGYDNIGAYYNFKVHTNNFVILHVQNKSVSDISALRQKLNKCNDLGISVGIVLDTEAENLSQMYQDVDFVQAIVKEYNIDLPVYCNINHIMNNRSLNNAERTTLINAFVDKATRSDMFLGIYGTDTNLADCVEYGIYDITSYDCYLVEDSETTRYEYTSTIREDQKGNITASTDLSRIIMSKGLNNSNKLVQTAKYVVKEGETFHTLGLRFGLSEEDLIAYNHHKKEVKPGEVIYIPNLYQTINQQTHEVSYSYAIARGIDISDYQTNLDWERISKTSDYVIIEVARDSANYEKNPGHFLEGAIDQIVDATSYDISVGLYFCISKDMKVSVYEQRLESYLTKLDEAISSRELRIDRSSIPVFLDFEVYYEHNDYYRLMSSFERICKDHGFCKIGIYGNRSTLNSITHNMKKDDVPINLKDTNWYVWQAGGPQYSSKEQTSQDDLTLTQIEELKNESYFEYTPVMQQVTNVCTDTGASNHLSHCDVSFLYDYAVFGDGYEQKLTGYNPYAETNETELVGSLEVDLSNYHNVPVSKALHIVDTTVTSLYAVLAISLIGKKLIIKLGRKNKGKRLSK